MFFSQRWIAYAVSIPRSGFLNSFGFFNHFCFIFPVSLGITMKLVVLRPASGELVVELRSYASLFFIWMCVGILEFIVR